MRRFLATTIKPRCLGVAMAALMGIATSWSGKAEGAFITVFDRTAFLNATFATSAGPIPDSNLSTFDFTYPSGDVTIESAADPETHFLVIGFGGGGDWTTRLPGADIAVDGTENVNFLINNGPVFSFGFDFAEPENDPNINTPPFIDSTYTVTLFNNGGNLFSFNFNAPNDVAAFVGVYGDQAFDRIEVREIIGGAENEFFGEVYTGSTPSSEAVPEPSSAILSLLALAAACVYARRRRRRSLRLAN